MQQLRCFCAAFELGSFTAAAETLRVSQPAVAEQIRKLEQALGTSLFIRAGRGVVATEAGRAFAEHATRSLRAVEDAADSVSRLTGLQTGTIAMGIFGGPSAWHLDELAVAFLRRHPNVSLRLVGSNSSVIAERVRGGSSRPACSSCRSTTTSSTSGRSSATRSSTSAPIRNALGSPRRSSAWRRPP